MVLLKIGALGFGAGIVAGLFGVAKALDDFVSDGEKKKDIAPEHQDIRLYEMLADDVQIKLRSIRRMPASPQRSEAINKLRKQYAAVPPTESLALKAVYEDIALLAIRLTEPLLEEDALVELEAESDRLLCGAA